MPDPASAPDLDLRLVRYFTAVAEHQHFGRAAEALRITQPSLSRQIRRLEQQVGARLLVRTPRGSRLTAAGETFLPRAEALLRAAARAVARTRAASDPSRIGIGYSTGVIVTPAVRELRRRHPDAEVHTRFVGCDEIHTALLDHQVDALVARSPFPADRLRVSVLYGEPRVLLVPLDHRLAGKESVTLADIADEPLPRLRRADPAWNAYWRFDPRPDGRPAPDGPFIDALEDKFELIASGDAVAVAAGLRAATMRPDVTGVPLRGVEPSQVLLATRAEDHSRLVTAFREAAHARLTGPVPA
ncbi:LysR substrate-binding domain-containing protein [Streptomyces sp. Ac-502]|uniref:LysR family transcriptional regulator n=1 Tax=Streptomyces sp. Ac-502 TaxID=3342801 RepID=UPI00386296D4